LSTRQYWRLITQFGLSQLRLVFTLVVALLVVLQLAVYGYEVHSWNADPDNSLLERICSHCHDPKFTHSYAKSPQEWRRTVKRMLDRLPSYGARVGKAERELIAAVLIRQRSADGPTLFRWRCGRCHERSVIEHYRGLAPAALRELVVQHTRQHNFEIQTWEGALVADYVEKLFAGRAKMPLDFLAGNQVLYARSCTTCHTVSFVYRTMCVGTGDLDQWIALVVRMQGKAPELIVRANAPILANYAFKVCQTGNPAP